MEKIEQNGKDKVLVRNTSILKGFKIFYYDVKSLYYFKPIGKSPRTSRTVGV